MQECRLNRLLHNELVKVVGSVCHLFLFVQTFSILAALQVSKSLDNVR